MSVFTSHLRPDRAPLLLREGFSWAAMLWGVFWMLAHGAWGGTAINLAGVIAAVLAGRATGSAAPFAALFVLQGVFGRDVLRWDLGLRGFVAGPVVAARDADEALARLLGERPDLLGGAPAAGARF